MKLLFLGESWLGSSARTLKEGLRRIEDSVIDDIDEVNEDLYIPHASAPWLRAVHRVLAPAYRHELAQAVLKKCVDTKPDIFLVYKGSGIDAELIRHIKSLGVFTVNVFPDYSPHAYGKRLRTAIGEYDLVISSKPFHPRLWQSLYGYNNPCVFVPHGYDPSVHLHTSPPVEFDYDVALVATWRPEYHDLMLEIATLLAPDNISIAIAGHGWQSKAHEFPDNWVFAGGITGIGLPRWSRRAKILLAPVNRNVVINGQRQPGDEDTSRTYELAAAYCFFIHRKTEYVSSLYDEQSEVPQFDSAEELAGLIRHYLPRDSLRFAMAASAHRRAVPAYSIDSRAKQVADIIVTRAKTN